MTEKSCNEWLKEMAEAGFTGKFNAQSGEVKYTGYITKDKEVKAVRLKTTAEARESFLKMREKL